MGGKFQESIYRLLSREPVTPNEVSKKLRISHKTALRTLMHLALTNEKVHYKNSGRIHLFWIETAQRTLPEKADVTGVF